jgi:hypothetical protein
VTNRALLTQAEDSQSIPSGSVDEAGLVSETIELLKTSTHQARQDNEFFPPLDVATSLAI